MLNPSENGENMGTRQRVILQDHNAINSVPSRAVSLIPPSWDYPDRQTVEKIYQKIRIYSRTGRFAAAEFWMDKIANMNNYENHSDLLSMCEYLFMDGQYAACRNVIESRGLHKLRTDFQFWLGRCYYETGELEEALRILGPRSASSPIKSSPRRTFSLADDLLSEVSDDDICMSPRGPRDQSGIPAETQEADEEGYLAAVHILRGKIYDKQDNRQMACLAYQQALEIDPYSSDALEYLSSRTALTAEENGKFILQVSRRTRENQETDEPSLLEMVYRSKFRPESVWNGENLIGTIPVEKSRFAQNPDFLLTKADYFLRIRDYSSTLEVTQQIMKKKPFHRSALPLHIAALVYLEKSSLLFDLSHKLVNLYPQDVMTWHATAAYYYVCGHMELTRRYLAKAIAIDKSCGHVWLLYGHSFSREKEHDQAMAAYFHAVDVMKGSFYPYMYIAREYVRTNNHILAERFYGEAKQLAPDDPVVPHDIGILHIKKADACGAKNNSPESKKELQTAVETLMHALNVIQSDSKEQRTLDSSVENIMETLATAYMKLRDGNEGLKYATLAYQKNSRNVTVLKLIGMCRMMLGQLQGATEAFQRTLAINKDDSFARRMLLEATDLLAEEGFGVNLPPVPQDLVVAPGIPRRTRVARAPSGSSTGDISRTSSRKIVKSKNQIVPGTSTTSSSAPVSKAPSVDGTDESVPMEISMDISHVAEKEPTQASFLGDFRGSVLPGDASEEPMV